MIDIMIAKVGKRFEEIKPIILKNFNIIRWYRYTDLQNVFPYVAMCIIEQ
jgi:hypothetical protein